MTIEMDRDIGIIDIVDEDKRIEIIDNDSAVGIRVGDKNDKLLWGVIVTKEGHIVPYFCGKDAYIEALK